MNKKTKETITEKCKRLETEIKKLNKVIFKLEEQKAKLEKQIITFKKKNIVLENKVLDFESKKTRRLEDLIAEYNEEQTGIKEESSN